ncbi:hypothetical protein [Pseudofrankia asymbiotica]|uniref:Uncharacterized protein n=1 Tax=Pseudofrankia asymbiotica TaxID=1834516 RepID=A0A1V2IHE2_9ACTN|nr:hypothetical protein [Pseudofrankia asymbiotica]ONH31851.1 hypothetical protein BL253_06760 [Pseudofrankia asymbiotica]
MTELGPAAPRDGTATPPDGAAMPPDIGVLLADDQELFREGARVIVDPVPQHVADQWSQPARRPKP